MIKGYVKGARNVNPFLCVESMCSGGLLRRWLPEVASGSSGFRGVASLDSILESILPARCSRKCLNMSQNFCRDGKTGFWVDSPVKKPVARKVPRCAPPYTNKAREEPCREGKVIGPLLPFRDATPNDPLEFANGFKRNCPGSVLCG